MAVLYDRSKPQKHDGKIRAKDIQQIIKQIGSYSQVYVPEFTYLKWRADAVLIDVQRRWIRGFEIKCSRADWKHDMKWPLYTQFCSSLTFVCPAGIIKLSEVPDPFGLIYVRRDQYGSLRFEWKKKASRFQNQEALSWYWTYTKVIELELRRLADELSKLKTSHMA